MDTIFRSSAKCLLAFSILIASPNRILSRAGNSLGVLSTGPNETYDDDWKEFSSSEGGFSVLFPKKPTESFGTVNVGKMIVKTRTYSVRDNETYSVSYFDVPHTANDPKVRADLLLGFRNFVLTELKGTLVTDSPLLLDQNEGRLLEVSIPKRGIARAIIIVADNRLYRVTGVPQKSLKNDSVQLANSLSDRFLRSFKLLAIDRSSEGAVDSYLRKNPEIAQKMFAGNGIPSVEGRAVKLPPPEYPDQARMARASGTIIVKVIIDEEGNVIAAQAIGGHPALQSSAEKAARQARFTPSLEHGQPIKILGKITYNFVTR
jgi:TonB family protein